MQQHINSQVESSISRCVQLLADPLHAQVHLPRHVVLVCALLKRQPGVVRLALMQPHHRHPNLHHKQTCCLLEKRKEKTTPLSVNLMRSQVLYRAAQAVSWTCCVLDLLPLSWARPIHDSKDGFNATVAIWLGRMGEVKRPSCFWLQCSIVCCIIAQVGRYSQMVWLPNACPYSKAYQAGRASSSVTTCSSSA